MLRSYPIACACVGRNARNCCMLEGNTRRPPAQTRHPTVAQSGSMQKSEYSDTQALANMALVLGGAACCSSRRYGPLRGESTNTAVSDLRRGCVRSDSRSVHAFVPLFFFLRLTHTIWRRCSTGTACTTHIEGTLPECVSTSAQVLLSQTTTAVPQASCQTPEHTEATTAM